MIEKLAVGAYCFKNDIAANGVVDTFEKIASTGIKAVELYNTCLAISAEEMKDLLGRLDLKIIASHILIPELENNLDGVIQYNKTVGNDDLVIPHYKYESEADVDRLVALVHKIAPKIKDSGMRLYFHNHAPEFQIRFGGKRVMDMIFERCADVGLLMENDLFWTQMGGENPVTYVLDHIEICPLLHLKDGIEGKDQRSFGNGAVDAATVIKIARSEKIKWAIFETDNPQPDALTYLYSCIENVKKLDSLC